MARPDRARPPDPPDARGGVAGTINSDDPPFFGATSAGEYRIAHRDMGFSPGDLRAFILTGLAGSRLPQADKDWLAVDWASEIDPLLQDHADRL